MHYNLNSKYYFINNFDTNNIEKQNKQTIIIYRNYNLEKIDSFKILTFKNYCKRRGLKFYLSNNIKLAIKLGLDGAYIPSFNKNFDHLSFTHKKNFKLIGSAHNLKEIRIKELQKVDKIFLSSLFKKNKNYLGINKFKYFSNLTKKRVVALGGVTGKNIKRLKLLSSCEFAGITFFQ
ncbi:thiamine phosphate synthase [Candidatus Pelagibacter bacterium nBUS_44]|uniref:thiamine phosphate synthase n=1 Tax=Candidatus Pelagibacter bacterium nBUS_44 TaxID=3374195 RepID=UPI003EBFF641